MPGSENGTTRKSHLLKVWAQTKKKPPELDAVYPPPMELMYLWNWLNQLPSPLLFTELLAWQDVMGIKLNRWEVEAIVSLDGVRSYG